jgi:hypothetical protein
MGKEVYHDTGDDGQTNVLTDTWQAQTFRTTDAFTIGVVSLKCWRNGTPGNITVGIRALDGDAINSKPTGSDLTSGTFNANTLPTAAGTAEWVNISLSAGYALSATTRYAIVIHNSPANTLYLRQDTDSGYADGGRVMSVDGSTWGAVSGTDDLMFRCYSEVDAPPSTDLYVTKKLVAVGSGELWYESAAGTMSQLADSELDIDTADFLTIAEAYGKIFVANGSNLKVADFQNTKIATTDVGSHPPDFGTVLTGGTSGAEMVVDYITSTTADAACTIYGKRTTTATFSAAETVTGTDDDDNSISFTTSAAETAPPHWYDWTVYGNDSSFGTMPDKANLVCRYRGRPVLSGNEAYPNQWYMAKVGNPWNWVYSTTDPLTAVAGNNTDAGLVGDTVTALIPYGDDFLIFGCAGSVYLLDGDPAFGGSLDKVADFTGIYGAKAWCKDAQDNLYFFGSNGLYMMQGGRSKPQNISELHLPNLISDWSPDQSTKRIILSYDPDRNGILISITTLTDGTNLNYFYNLKTEGFYPDTFPTACGIFSSYYYEATNSTYKGLLVGSNDGYIREFLDTAKNDDSGASDTAISSYVTLSPMPMSEDLDRYGKLQTLTFELAGGASSGAYSDTDGVTYALYKGNDAETIIEDIIDGATAFTSGTLTGTGRKNKIRPRMRSTNLGMKLYNSTASQTWAINKIYGNIVPSGKV